MRKIWPGIEGKKCTRNKVDFMERRNVTGRIGELCFTKTFSSLLFLL